MNNLKKILNLFLLLSAIFLFVGCRTEKEKPGDDPFDCISIAEAIRLAEEAGEEGTDESYCVRGTIKKITKFEFGEMDITDGTYVLHIYGVVDKNNLFYSKFEDKPFEGDEIVVCGKLKTFKNKPEMDRSVMMDMKHNQGDSDIDLKEYRKMTVLESREADEGTKVKVSGVVAFITQGQKGNPNGVFLVDNTGCVYVFGPETAQRVNVGDKIDLVGEKAYFVSDKEKALAEKNGYKGSCQIKNPILIDNDKQKHEFDKSWIKKTTVKEILDSKDYSGITGNIYKVDAFVHKVPGTGYVNYYINDLDDKTGSYVYTSNNGSDFAFLDEFDGKICTVYLSPLNYKSTDSGLICRFTPILVKDELYRMSDDDICQFVIDYKVRPLFLPLYQADPELLLPLTVSDEKLAIENVKLSYECKESSVTTELIADDLDHCLLHISKPGEFVVTITAVLDETHSYSEDITFKMEIPTSVDAKTVAEAIKSADDEEVTVKGIVMSSLVNQCGFYLNDGTGVIAVKTTEEELSKIDLGNEVIIKGIRWHQRKKANVKSKDAEGNEILVDNAGQSCIKDAKVLINKQGNHEYSVETFDNEKKMEDLLSLPVGVDLTTQVFTVKVKVIFIANERFTSVKLVSPDDEKKELSLYCSGANQYAFLKDFADREVTAELMLCNWNDKAFYKACVISVNDGDVKKINDLNFNKGQ